MFTKTKIKKYFFYLLFIISLLVFFDFNIALAADGDAGSVAVVTGATLISILGMALGLLTALVSLFLNPGWVNGELFGLTTYLKELWILVSNIVYFVFAGLLIVIAFMNIIGKGGDKFELKQALPRFIVGILMVPFSWFFVQFILSISAILTVSVLTIPYDSFPEITNYPAFKNKLFCKERTIDMRSGSGTKANQNFDCKEKDVSLQDMISGDSGDSQSLYGIVSVYTYGVLDFENLNALKEKNITEISSILDVGVYVIINLLFIIIYLILLFALFIALFTRGIYLWLYAMFSPLFGLVHFFGGHVGKDGFIHHFNIKDFIGLAMVPVLVSAALSFGLLFLLVAGKGLAEPTTSSKSSLITPNGFKMGVMNIKILGLESKDKGDGGSDFISELFTGTGSVLGKLIVKLFGLALLWTAVMAALKSSEITKHAVEPISQFGESVGKLIHHAPQYIPIPGTGGMGAKGLANLGGSFSSQIENAQTKKGTDWGEKMGILKTSNREYSDSLNDFVTHTNNNNSKRDDASFQKARNFLQKSDLDKLSKNKTDLIRLANGLEKVGIATPEQAKKLRENVSDQDSLEKVLKEINDSGSNDGKYLLGRSVINDDDVGVALKEGRTNNNSQQNNININYNNYVGTNGDINVTQGSRREDIINNLVSFMKTDNSIKAQFNKTELDKYLKDKLHFTSEQARKDIIKELEKTPGFIKT